MPQQPLVNNMKKLSFFLQIRTIIRKFDKLSENVPLLKVTNCFLYEPTTSQLGCAFHLHGRIFVWNQLY